MTRVLIAEDEENIVTSLEFLMRGCGFETAIARDGETALKSLEEATPDVVLLDIMLPGRSGFEICRHIRADPRLAGVRVLILTAKGGSGEIERGFAAGADDYMMKPFGTRELVARVRSLVARERAR